MQGRHEDLGQALSSRLIVYEYIKARVDAEQRVYTVYDIAASL